MLPQMIRLLVHSKQGGGSRALTLQKRNEREDIFRLTYSTLVTSKWARNTHEAAGPSVVLSPVARASMRRLDIWQYEDAYVVV